MLKPRKQNTTSPMLAKLDVSDLREMLTVAFNKPFPHEAYRVQPRCAHIPLKRTLAKRAMEKRRRDQIKYQENQLIVDVIILGLAAKWPVFQQGRARLYKGKKLIGTFDSVVTVSR
ncbi:hypothetical protein SPFM7_00147 [Salmonella phage SPFM7]|nr:hypothetical protein SPFM7_00147 [Salmonella phage SPFM7]